MKIIKKKEKFAIPFEDVGCGEIFEYDGTYWMKVYYDIKGKYFAVCLADGEFCEEFEPSDMCRVVEAELYILD